MSKQANDIIRKLQRYKKSLGVNDYRHIYETLTAQMSEAGVQVPNGNRSKQVVQQIGYSEGQMRQHEQATRIRAVNETITLLGDFYNTIIEFRQAASDILTLIHHISDNINHPNATFKTSRDYLMSSFPDADGRSLSDMLTAEITRLEKVEIAMDPDKGYEGDETSIINYAALIRRELLKLERAVKAQDEARQETIIRNLQSLFEQYQTPALQRQIEIRSQMNMGGNIRGMKPFNRELAEEWIEITNHHPDMTPGEIMLTLLDARQKPIENNGQKYFVQRNPQDMVQKKQIDVLEKNLTRASKYRHDLLKAYYGQVSELTP